MLLSLLSKESAVLFLTLSLIYCWLFKPEKLKPLFITNIAAFVMYLMLRYPIAHMNQAQGSIAQISQAPLIERMIHIPAIITYYLQHFFFPLQISIDQFWFIQKLTWSDFYWPLIISASMLIIIAAGAIVFYKYYKKLFKTYLFFSLWFLIGLLLHLQIIPLDATVADRWLYFPIVGLLGMIAIFIQIIKIRSKLLKKLLFACCLLLILFLSFRTFQRNFEWKDDLTLLSHDIKITPKNFILDNLYANALINDGQITKAKPYVESSVKEHPFYANLNNMAIIYSSEGNYKEAKKYLWRAVQGSRFYVVYENYANFLLVYDNLNEAERFTKEALRIFPKNSKLWMILAKIQYFKGDKSLAIKSAEMAYSIIPSDDNKKIISDIKSNKLEDLIKNKVIK